MIKKNLLSVTVTSLLVCLTVFIEDALATRPLSHPYYRPWSNPADNLQPNRPARPFAQFPRRDPENYIGQFERLCQFLDGMQEHEEGDDEFGGLHEGEGNNLWRIVETDNTQEAIRVWCEYAAWFDDLELYRQNIADAWTYTDNFPAWEEDEGDIIYYGIHNCGWGLIAEMAYRTVYNDDSRREYGINCAEHLVNTTPEIPPDMQDQLLPLTAGWAAGTLYEYGVFEDNNEYKEAALNIAEDVMEWIDADRDRLFNNERWALCGGTAMWGVLQSLGQDDSTATADWAIEALESMDVFAGRGNWNNSWNIWYAHAWLSAWRLTGNDDYLANVITIVDSLVVQDGDGDGGIPATGGNPDDRDESWVSSYTGWMGLRQLFDVLPGINIRVMEVLQPALDRPLPVTSEIDFTFSVVNAGDVEQVNVPFRLRGGWEIDTSLSIDGWQPLDFTLNRRWTPDEPGDIAFAAFVDHENDGDRSDDTLRFTVNILPVGQIEMSVISVSEDVDDPVSGLFSFYNLDIDPDELYVAYDIDEEDMPFDSELMVGNYRVEVIPEFPFPRKSIDRVEITDDGINTIQIRVTYPPVLLIDNDTDSTNAAYYKDALSELGYEYYHWRSDILGPFGRSGSLLFPTVIYFTGDKVDGTLPEEDKQELIRFMSHHHFVADGGLFITGQYIADDLENEEFLREVLHCRHLRDDMSRPHILGIDQDEVFDGMDMLTLGNPGANNQDARSGIFPTDNAVICAEYADRPDTAAAVRWEEQSGKKGIFFGFGFEAISGRIGNSREEVLGRILDWFGTPTEYEAPPYSDASELPTRISLSAFPNPFNSSVIIRSNAGITPNNIGIFDVNGRILRNINNIQNSTTINWDGCDSNGRLLPAGIYLVRLGYGTGGVTSWNKTLKVVLTK